MIENGKYIGNELELFEHAKHWKNYFHSLIRPYIKGDVLEVGAGIGGTTAQLCDGTQNKWICLEPDTDLIKEFKERQKNGGIPSMCTISSNYLSEVPSDELFDAILYMDVIEHIEDDAGELDQAMKHLKEGGALIVLVPAHQFLYTPFDKKIGHFRRYSRSRLKSAVPKQLKEVGVRYLDSTGLLASLANKLFLKSDMPSAPQIKFWDRFMVPLSRFTDRITFFSLGKSVLGIWRKGE
jgi:2-polyprenyl-3-methyl-5-hydroxy-6-metoxy-1,4-benzoquinol methylase